MLIFNEDHLCSAWHMLSKDLFGHHASLLHLGVLKKKLHTFSLHLLKDQRIYLSQITRWEKIWFLMSQLLAQCDTNITTVQLNQQALLATPMLTR